MAVRLSGIEDINTQNALSSLEKRLASVEALIGSLQQKGASNSSDLERFKAEVGRNLRKPQQLDFTDVFRASGSAHALGYVPDPGHTEGNERVLTERGWGYPARGVVRSATDFGLLGGVQYAIEIVEVNGGLSVLGPLSSAAVETIGLTVYGTSKLSVGEDPETVTAGTNDSGGAGFRLLRIPN